MKQTFDKEAWYCIRTQPKSEHIAAGCVGVIEGVEVYCPRLRFRKMTRRGPVWFAEALFPGYLFARFVPMESQKEVTYARGVSGIVHFGDQLASIPDATISELRAQMGNENCKTFDPEIREGDNVMITRGAFQGLTTVVTQLMSAKERVRVLIEFLGQVREVEVEKDHVLPERQHFLAA
ncbi:MAG TPA: transcription termination/antitermination NusG family protein [Chthoniobacteraceae bacterium]|jgi:transcriptional antiterminator RfaH|nr:transcription termination/antitermination NusG family protein [Chthoniobacteraceae bacterium]